MRAALITTELRRRSGRFAWLLVAATVAVTFGVAAFGFASQVSGMLGTDAVEVGSLIPAGTITVTVDSRSLTTATALDRELVDRIRRTEGVALAEGTFDQPVQFRIPRGSQDERPVALRGLVLSAAWSPERWRVVDGRPPSGPTEIAVDLGGALVGQVRLGEEAGLWTPVGLLRVRIVGIVEPAPTREPSTPGTRDARPRPADRPTDVETLALANAHAVFDPDWIGPILAAGDRVDRINVTPLPDADLDEVTDRIRALLPAGLRVTPVTDAAAATQQSVAALDEAVGSAVQAVAVLTALLSVLVVTNTLGVLVAQRTRELGLLRALGASRSQLRRAVVGQSVAVGVLASAVGLALGAVLAGFAATWVSPAGRAVRVDVTPTMVVAAVVIGVAVTGLGALPPSIRAGRIPPMAALSDSREGGERRGGFAAVPALGTAAALLAGAAQVLERWDRGLLAAAAVLGAAAVVRLARWLVTPLTWLPGRLLALAGGAVGRLAWANVAARPVRSAAAGSALLIGLSLVGLVATAGASVRSTVADAFDAASSADRYLDRRGVVRISPDALAAALTGALGPDSRWVLLSSLDGFVGNATRSTPALVADVDTLVAMADLDVVAGGPPRRGDLMLSEETARELEVAVGDPLTVSTFGGRTRSARVSGLYRNTTIAGPALLHLDGPEASELSGTVELGLVELARRGDGRALRGVTERFPLLRSMRPHQFDELNTRVTTTVLRIVSVVLVGLVSVGYLGLTATLGLSTLERRHELRVLRSVGALRDQVRSMILAEAMLVATVSAAVGLAAGAVAGALAVDTLPANLANHLVVPTGLLVAIGLAAVTVAAVVVVGVGRRAANSPVS